MQARTALFLILIPAIIAFSHDIYLFYDLRLSEDPSIISIDLILEKFKLASLGFLWTTYNPESYKEAAKSLDPETWALIDSYLPIKLFHIGLAFAGFWVVVFTVLKLLFKKGPFSGSATKSLKTRDTIKSKRR